MQIGPHRTEEHSAPATTTGAQKLSWPLLIGGGFVGALCLVVLCFALLVLRLSPLPSSALPTADSNAVNTAVFQTAFAAQLSTLSVQSPTALPTATIPPGPETPTEILATPTPSYADMSGITGASCIPANAPQYGKVVDVVDGDTIKVVLDGDGKTYSVRYIGMDTPEMTTPLQYYAPEASARNSQLVSGKNVVLMKDVSEMDRYGRLLRYVIADNIFVNYELVAQGYAKTASYPPDTACIPSFQTAEQVVSVKRIGIWASPTAISRIPLATAPSSGSGSAPCSCSGNLYNCGDFSSHASAQACYDYCKSMGKGDIHRLDGDSDGEACENLP